MKKTLLLSLGSLGTLLFLPLFVLSLMDPNLIESQSKAFVEWKLNQELEQKVDQIAIPKNLTEKDNLGRLLGAGAKLLESKANAKIELIKEQLKNEIPKVIAKEIAELRNLSCECRAKWEQKITARFNLELVDLQARVNQLSTFTQGKYMEIVTNLTLDIQIFLGTNAFVFLSLVLAGLVKPRAIAHLFVPGILLFVSTLFVSYFYLFEQNWLLTLLYNDFTGYLFIGYLAIVYAFLLDIFFNSGRITTEIANTIISAISSAAPLSPC